METFSDSDNQFTSVVKFFSIDRPIAATISDGGMVVIVQIERTDVTPMQLLARLFIPPGDAVKVATAIQEAVAIVQGHIAGD